MKSDYFAKEPPNNLREEGIRIIKKIISETKEVIKTNIVDKFENFKSNFMNKYLP